MAERGVYITRTASFLPKPVTGVNGMSGWQENFSGYSGDYKVAHAGGYYHTNGIWNRAHKITFSGSGYAHTNSDATYSGLFAESDAGPSFTSLYNVTKTITLTDQATTPTFDPILVTNAAATVYGSQLLVQWEIPPPSSPQLGYLIEVFDNPGYTNSPAVTFFEREPETPYSGMLPGFIRGEHGHDVGIEPGADGERQHRAAGDRAAGHAHRLELRFHEAVDVVRGPTGQLRIRSDSCLRLLKCPELTSRVEIDRRLDGHGGVGPRIGSAHGHPFFEVGDDRRTQRATGGHLAGAGAADRLDQQRLFRISRYDRRAGVAALERT